MEPIHPVLVGLFVGPIVACGCAHRAQLAFPKYTISNVLEVLSARVEACLVASFATGAVLLLVARHTLAASAVVLVTFPLFSPKRVSKRAHYAWAVCNAATLTLTVPAAPLAALCVAAAPCALEPRRARIDALVAVACLFEWLLFCLAPLLYA